jgi:hypothetical protein
MIIFRRSCKRMLVDQCESELYFSRLNHCFICKQFCTAAMPPHLFELTLILVKQPVKDFTHDVLAVTSLLSNIDGWRLGVGLIGDLR